MERLRRLLFRESDNVVDVTTRSGSSTKYSIIPIGSTESFLFGVELTGDLTKERKKPSETGFRPTVRAIPFSDIVRLDYGKSEFRAPYLRYDLSR